MTIKVYHNAGMFNPPLLVARVETRHKATERRLGEAFELTNSVENHWRENQGVYELNQDEGGNRSTSVGDIMVDEEDESVHVVVGRGFERLNFGF